MEFTCNKIDITDSGIGVQVQFENLNGDSEQYFLIQRYFDGYSKTSYIQTKDCDIAGHYRPKIELSQSKCIFEFEKKQLVINLKIKKEKFEELKKYLKTLGVLEIKN